MVTKTKPENPRNLKEIKALRWYVTPIKNTKAFTPYDIWMIAFLPLIFLMPIIFKGIPNGFDFSIDVNWFSSAYINSDQFIFWDLALFLSSVAGAIGTILKRRKIIATWIPAIIDPLIYGFYMFFLVGSYALGAINMFILPLITLYGRWEWGRSARKGDVKKTHARQLNMKQALWLIAGSIVATVAVGTILAAVPLPGSDASSWTTWVDSYMAVIAIFGGMLGALRYRENYYLWLISNVTKIIAWSVLIAQGNLGMTQSLLIAIMYLGNAVAGTVDWADSKVEDIRNISKKDERS